MALSDDTRRAIRAYDSFTDFARCPDLLWPPATYERLDPNHADPAWADDKAPHETLMAFYSSYSSIPNE